MKTFVIFKKSHFNYLSFTIRWPHIDIRYKKTDIIDGEHYNKFGLYMPTGIHWSNSFGFVNLGIEILGFGIQITRQWNY